MQWLNANAGAVQAIATIVLVAVTLHYAWSTHRLSRDQRESQLARFRPFVVLTSFTWFSEHSVTHEPTVRVTIRNLGLGPAFDLGLQVIPSSLKHGPIFHLVGDSRPNFCMDGSGQEELFFPIRGAAGLTRPVIEALEQGDTARTWVRYRDGLGQQHTNYMTFATDERGVYHISEAPTGVSYPSKRLVRIYRLIPWKRKRLMLE